MAKKPANFTEDWFLERGYTKDAGGNFVPPLITKGFIGQRNGFNKQADQPRIKAPDMGGLQITKVIIDESTHINLPQQSVLVIDGLVAGLNGSKGLMQAHWSKNNKTKLLYQTIIAQHLRENKIKQHLGEVTIEYIGYKSRFMDWDNFCASFKLLGDSLTKMKIIVDDNPNIVVQFIPSQIKVKQVDQKVVIIIKDK